MISRFLTFALDLIAPPVCRGCRRDGRWLCRQCLAGPPVILPFPTPAIERLFALGPYDRPAIGLAVRELKYSGGRVLVEPLAEAMVERFSSSISADAIVPVPLHRRRQRRRGFNQSDALARAVGRRMNIPVEAFVEKTVATTPQAKLSEIDRRRNVRGTFRLRPDVEIVPKRGIIIDDVFTTGATVSAVSDVLRSAGMQTIIALTVAKS